MDLLNLLISSCVRIGTPNLFGRGTGFFIDDYHILTCNHNLVTFNPNKIPILIANNIYDCVVIESTLSKKFDVALLRAPVKSNSVVYLNDWITTGDKLTIFGFPDSQNVGGETINLEYEGPAFDGLHIEYLKMKNGQLLIGQSGSPILNLTNGYVVGMVSETRHPHLPHGGYGISIKSIMQCYPNISRTNINYHYSNHEWKSKNKFLKFGLGIYDNTTKKNHFNLLNTNISIDDIFIEPNYKIIRFISAIKEFERKNLRNIICDSIEILEQKKFLLLLGSFGTGKTIITKKIQKAYLDNGNQTLHFNCSDLSNISDYSYFYKEINSLKNKQYPLYCFFDGFDELNLLSKEKLELINEFLKNLIKLSREPDIYILVNSRNIHKNEDEVYESISLQFEELRRDNIDYIVLEEFQDEQITNYLDSFANAMAINKKEHRIYISDIKKLHKSLKKACNNPLFLYCILSDYYENDGNFSNLYDIYQTFVNNTVTGKFKIEGESDNLAIREIADKYKYFLRRLANEILIINRDIKFDLEQIYDFYLDDNLNSYTIDNKKLSGEIKELAVDILSDELLNRISNERLRQNILTCYFLDNSINSWKFKDNNVLFFLVAEAYFEKLSKTLDAYLDYLSNYRGPNNSIEMDYSEELYKSFKYEKRIPLHPLTLEFLFLKIDHLSDNYKYHLWVFIKKLITDNKLLNISVQNIKKLDANKINIDFILILIFKRINKKEYRDINLLYFFKRYQWLLSAAKIIDRNYQYLARRFFKESNIAGVELRRINFDGYNFDYSSLRDVKFIQGKFHDVRMNNCIFENVDFVLCDLLKVDFSDFKGNVEFNNCIVGKLYFRNPKKHRQYSKIEFKHCQIKRIEFHSQDRNLEHTIDLEFNSCRIDTVIIKNTMFDNLSISNCISSNFKFDRNLVNTLIENGNYKA